MGRKYTAGLCFHCGYRIRWTKARKKRSPEREKGFSPYIWRGYCKCSKPHKLLILHPQEIPWYKGPHCYFFTKNKFCHYIAAKDE